MTLVICTRCGSNKPLIEFITADGFMSFCEDCGTGVLEYGQSKWTPIYLNGHVFWNQIYQKNTKPLTIAPDTIVFLKLAHNIPLTEDEKTYWEYEKLCDYANILTGFCGKCGCRISEVLLNGDMWAVGVNHSLCPECNPDYLKVMYKHQTPCSNCKYRIKNQPNCQRHSDLIKESVNFFNQYDHFLNNCKYCKISEVKTHAKSEPPTQSDSE